MKDSARSANDVSKDYVGIDVPHGFRTALPEQQVEVLDAPGALAAGDSRFRLVLCENGTVGLDPEAHGMCGIGRVDGLQPDRVVTE